MIQIKHTGEPYVEVDGQKLGLKTKGFTNSMWQGNKLNPFLSFEKYLEEEKDRGYTKFYMSKMWTEEGPETAVNPFTILWVRGIFVK